jgi:hypothetical protein
MVLARRGPEWGQRARHSYIKAQSRRATLSEVSGRGIRCSVRDQALGLGERRLGGRDLCFVRFSRGSSQSKPKVTRLPERTRFIGLLGVMSDASVA